MDNKSAIIYATAEKPEPARKDDYSIVGAKDSDGEIFVIWIRMEIVNAPCLIALDDAHPRRNEIVLNSIELITEGEIKCL